MSVLGVQGEERHDYTKEESRQIRKRSLRLLGSLVRPVQRKLALVTVVVVAHRPSTVMLADRVALLEGGRISAVGTHSELLATSEHYRYVISSLEDEERAREEVGA